MRVWLEAQLLVEWSARILDGRTSDAARSLTRAQPLADAYARDRDELFFRAAIAAAGRAAGGAESARALAIAHQQCARAGDAYDTDRVASVAALAQDAIAPLERAHSPFAAAARRYRAIGLYFANDFDAALTEVSAGQRDAAQASRYPRLLGLARARLEGVIDVVKGSTGGLGAYQAALASFRATGDTTDEAAIQASLAEDLQLVGDVDASWHARFDAMSLLGGVLDPIA